MDDYTLSSDEEKVNPFPDPDPNLYGDWIKTLRITNNNNGLKKYVTLLTSYLKDYSLLQGAPSYTNIGNITVNKCTSFKSTLTLTDDCIQAWINILISVLHANDNIKRESIDANELILLHIGLKKANNEMKIMIQNINRPITNGMKDKEAKKINRIFDECKKFIEDWIQYIDITVLPIFYDKIAPLDIWSSFVNNPISTRFGYWEIIYKGVSLNEYQQSIVKYVMQNGRKFIYDRMELGKGKTSIYSCLSKFIELYSNNPLANRNVTIIFTGPDHVRNTALCIARTAQLHIALLEKWVHFEKNKPIIDTTIITNNHHNKLNEPDPKVLLSDYDRFNVLNKINHIHLLVGNHEAVNIFLNNYRSNTQGCDTKFIVVIDEWITELNFNLINTALNHNKVNTLVIASGTAPLLDKIPTIKECITKSSLILPRTIICLEPTKIPHIGVVNTFPDTDDDDDEPIRIVSPFSHLPPDISKLREYLISKHFRYEIQRGMTLYVMANLVIEMKETSSNYTTLWRDDFADLNPDIFFKCHGFSDSSAIKWMNCMLVYIDKFSQTDKYKNYTKNFYKFLREFLFTYSDGEITSKNYPKLSINNNDLILGLTHSDSWSFMLNTLPIHEINCDDIYRSIAKYRKDNDRYEKSFKSWIKKQDAKETKKMMCKKSKNKNRDDDDDDSPDDDQDIPVKPVYHNSSLNKYLLSGYKSLIDIDILDLLSMYTIEQITALLTRRGALSETNSNHHIIFNLHKLSTLSFTPGTSSGLNTTAKDIFISNSIKNLDTILNPTIKDVIDIDDRQAFGRVARQNHKGICKIHFENANAMHIIINNDYDMLTAKALEREYYTYMKKIEILKCKDEILKKELIDTIKKIEDNEEILPFETLSNDFTNFINDALSLYSSDIVEDKVAEIVKIITEQPVTEPVKKEVKTSTIMEKDNSVLEEVKIKSINKPLMGCGIYRDLDGNERVITTTRILIPEGWVYIRPIPNNSKSKKNK